MSVFLNIPEDQKLHVSTSFFIIKDRFPVSPGHCLIISKKQKQDYFELSIEEKEELLGLLEVAKTIIERDYSPDGYNIGMNSGEAAGQTIMHFHCHLIPRYKGDMKDPRGGIRHCIEGKGYY
jgi:diadenosine tetraphosphate (Ap4A) HIT family hydrolase